ncbi:MAG: hypothetical protein JW723_07080 [Bacteroidales bacterium]|nr:hypothetical protein [Bacteroidales bacterium]
MIAVNLDKVIYQLTIEDIQNVADDFLGRLLTINEIELIEGKIGDNIDWYCAIVNTITLNIK